MHTMWTNVKDGGPRPHSWSVPSALLLADTARARCTWLPLAILCSPRGFWLTAACSPQVATPESPRGNGRTIALEDAVTRGCPAAQRTVREGRFGIIAPQGPWAWWQLRQAPAARSSSFEPGSLAEAPVPKGLDPRRPR